MPKKLADLKKAELEELAEGFAVDLDGATTKAKIIDRLQEEGVTDAVLAATDKGEGDSAVADTSAEPAEKKAPLKPENTVIVYMRKANPTYEIFGHKFTQAHPYVPMSEEDAQEIFDAEPRGFSIATPAQAKEYYS